LDYLVVIEIFYEFKKWFCALSMIGRCRLICFYFSRLRFYGGGVVFIGVGACAAMPSLIGGEHVSREAPLAPASLGD
jgi:hypothetical protein